MNTSGKHQTKGKDRRNLVTIDVDKRNLTFCIIMLILALFVFDYALDTAKMFFCKERTYATSGIVTCADTHTATIVDESGEAWTVSDKNLRKCDSVEMIISNNGTVRTNDDYIVYVG